jgi:hypothetical protein
MASHGLGGDDEPDFVELILHGLRAKGVECSVAFAGVEARG